MSNTEGMWDLPIAELKVGGINGISFRRNQPFGKRKPAVEVEIVVTDIRREIDDLDEEVFLVFARRDNEDRDVLLKVSKGNEVYVTFDVFED